MIYTLYCLVGKIPLALSFALSFRVSEEAPYSCIRMCNFRIAKSSAFYFLYSLPLISLWSSISLLSLRYLKYTLSDVQSCWILSLKSTLFLVISGFLGSYRLIMRFMKSMIYLLVANYRIIDSMLNANPFEFILLIFERVVIKNSFLEEPF